MTRRGVTLIELLVATVLTVVLSGLALGTLRLVQGLTQRQAERTEALASLRTAAQVLRQELTGVRAGSPPDLRLMDPTRIVYASARATAMACGAAPGLVLLRDSTYRGLRLPSPGRDSLEFLKVMGTTVSWSRVAVIGTPSSGQCPDGDSALLVPIAGTMAAGGGTPVRLFEVMELKAYRNGTGEDWLGIRSVSAGETIQPIVGPLARAGGAPGFAIRYFDAMGSPSTDPTTVARLEFTIRVQPSALMAAGGGAHARGPAGVGADSIEVVVRLPNGDPAP